MTAPLLTAGVNVNLPQADAEPISTEEQEPFVVTVDADGNYYLNDVREKIVSADELTNNAKVVLARNPSTPFLVRGDASVAYSFVVRAMVLLQSAGVQSVGLVTETPSS